MFGSLYRINRGFCYTFDIPQGFLHKILYIVDSLPQHGDHYVEISERICNVGGKNVGFIPIIEQFIVNVMVVSRLHFEMNREPTEILGSILGDGKKDRFQPERIHGRAGQTDYLCRG